MGKRVRILRIAPYKRLVTLVKRYGNQRDDIWLTTILGSAGTGLSLAKEHHRNYNIIVSRTNATGRIAKGVPISVIDIGIDYYDMLLCLKAAENTKTKFAALRFRSLITIARSICNVPKMPTDIFSVDTTSEASSLLGKLKEQDYKTVIRDTVPYNHARLIGITPILLTFSTGNLKAAIDQAVYTRQTHRDLYHSLSLIHQLLDSSASRLPVLSRTGECLCTILEDEIAVPIQTKLRNELEQCYAGRKRASFVTVNNQIYSITSHLTDETLSPYIIFHITRSETPLAYSECGVTIMDKQLAEDNFMDSFHNNTELVREILINTKEAAPSPLGLMITGKTGTGKNRVAYIYHAKGLLRDNSLYAINCSLISDKSWGLTTKHYNSLFMDNGNIIYTSNLDALQKTKQKQLLSIILDTNMHVRNHLIFSCTQPVRSTTPHVVFEYTNALGCILVPIEPLQEQKGDIVSSAGLYINTLNQELNRQVVRIDDGAAALLEQYDYPYNRTQFKRILKEAIIRTEGSYIRAQTIQEVIRGEDVLFSGLPLPARAPLGGSGKDTAAGIQGSTPPDPYSVSFHLGTSQFLDEMNRDIVYYVLKTCGGSQTSAAKKLGISRATLWRYLNQQTNAALCIRYLRVEPPDWNHVGGIHFRRSVEMLISED